MNENAKLTNSQKGAVRFFSITLIILLLSSILIWGFQTNWGSVAIKRINMTGDNGAKISSLVYIPENAANETPAPAVMMFHGRSNQGHSNDTWSMELARRGYVVFSPDLSGGGESDVTDRDSQAVALTTYVTTLNYVKGEDIICVGYSAGCNTCASVAKALPENVATIVACLGPNLTNPIKDLNLNYGVIKAVADQYNWMFIGDVQACEDAMTQRFALPEAVVPGKDYDINGRMFRYMVSEDALHQTGNISQDTLDHLISYVTAVEPAPNPLPLDDQAWLPQQIFSGIACVDMMFLFAAMLNLLMQNSFFAAAANPVPTKEPRKGGKAWALDLLFSVGIPAVIFIPVSAYGMAWFAESRILTSTNLNGIMIWLLVLAAIGIVRTVLKVNKKKKAGYTPVLSDFALGAEGQKKIDWSVPAKGILLGAISVTFIFVWLAAVEGFAGINYQVWNLSTYLRLSPGRFVRAIPYMLIIFTVMFLGNTNQRVLPTTGSAKKDMWLAVTVNTVLTAGALFLLLVIQYGGNFIIGTGQAVFEQMTLPGVKGTSVGALDFAFGYCYMMGGTTGVVTYMYRKYGNIWVGVIPCAIFAGLVTTAGFTLVR